MREDKAREDVAREEVTREDATMEDATMGDATGFGTGGTTSVIKVGPQVGSTSCNTTDPGSFCILNASYRFSDYPSLQGSISSLI